MPLPRRRSPHNSSVGNVASDYRACTYERACTDFGATDDCRVGSDDTATHQISYLEVRQLADTRILDVGEHDGWSDEHVVLNEDIFVDRDVVLDFDVITYVNVGTNVDVLTEDAVTPNMSASADMDPMPDESAPANSHLFIYDCRRMNHSTASRSPSWFIEN